jgi:sodium-dependent phosphate transporter
MARVGVGLCELLKGGINWKLFGSQIAGWVSTLLVVALSTAAVFAQGIYTPNKPGLLLSAPPPKA